MCDSFTHQIKVSFNSLLNISSQNTLPAKRKLIRIDFRDSKKLSGKITFVQNFHMKRLDKTPYLWSLYITVPPYYFWSLAHNSNKKYRIKLSVDIETRFEFEIKCYTIPLIFNLIYFLRLIKSIIILVVCFHMFLVLFEVFHLKRDIKGINFFFAIIINLNNTIKTGLFMTCIECHNH